MGLRFRKSIKLGKHFSVNLSPKGIGYSYGVKGARHSVSADGRHRTTYSVPGTGLAYTTSSSNRSSGSTRTPSPRRSEPTPPKNTRKSPGCLILVLLFIAVSTIALACSDADTDTTEQSTLPPMETSERSFPPPDSETEPAETEPAVQLPVVEPAAALAWSDDSTLLIPEGDTGTVSLRFTPGVDPVSVVLSEIDPSVLTVTAKITDNYIHYTYQAVSPGVVNLSASCINPELSSTVLQIIVEDKPETSAVSVPGVLVQEEPTQTVTYYLNTSTQKIHRADCSSVPKIKDSNKSTTTDPEAMIAEGYTWCGICH